MPNDPIADALVSLHAQREALQREVNRLSQAIMALEALDTHLPNRGAPPVIRVTPPGARPSVKQMMLNLLYEDGRDWSVNEILAEYEKRGTPVHAKDPSNALRAAITEENKAGTIRRTEPGRYLASIFDPGPAYDEGGSMRDMLSGGPHPESEISASAERRLREAFPGADAAG